ATGYDCAGYPWDPDCNPDCHDDGRTEITDEELARLIARDPERTLPSAELRPGLRWSAARPPFGR
ncbi:hypothetical protein, partial [Mycolicibacterium insubricum]|uniref:hypothetical protein n=1 Tax=Mycolicibacterium insubricum TaxID=444597 RepID=UPI0021F310F4